MCEYYGKQKIFLIIIILFVIISSGCIDVKQPTVSGSATIKHIRLTYDLDIIITNSNDFDFTMGDISIELQRNNSEIVGSGAIGGGKIQKLSSKHIYGTLELNDAMLTAQDDEKLYLILDTKAKATVYLIPKEDTIHKKIEINNPIKGKTKIEILI